MRYRQQPFDQRHPPVEVMCHVGVVDVQVDSLFFDSRRILASEEHQVGADSVPEAGQLARKVEPPARIALANDDHQGRGYSQTTRQPTSRVPSSSHNLTRL